MANISQSSNVSITFKIEYLLFLPGGKIWMFTELVHDRPPADKFAVLYSGDAIRIPIDLITAVRLRLIKPGDDSGIGDEQWAWFKLIGLT